MELVFECGLMVALVVRLFGRKGLMLPRPKPRHTTNSNHRYHKWKNLVKGFVPTAANQLWVADITYIALAGGDVCYLHLITDAYSHKIVGWALARTLKAAISMEALEMAIRQAVAMRGSESLCLQFLQKIPLLLCQPTGSSGNEKRSSERKEAKRTQRGG